MAQGQVYSSSGYGGGSWVNTGPQVQVVLIELVLLITIWGWINTGETRWNSMQSQNKHQILDRSMRQNAPSN
jgi:protein-S-isoprenylcysteine O-methyltransferase Ste14